MAKKLKETGNKFQDALEKLNKQYGQGTVLALNSKQEGTMT